MLNQNSGVYIILTPMQSLECTAQYIPRGHLLHPCPCLLEITTTIFKQPSYWIITRHMLFPCINHTVEPVPQVSLHAWPSLVIWTTLMILLDSHITHDRLLLTLCCQCVPASPIISRGYEGVWSKSPIWHSNLNCTLLNTGGL